MCVLVGGKGSVGCGMRANGHGDGEAMWSYEQRQAAVNRRIEEVRARRNANARALVEFYDSRRRVSMRCGAMTTEKRNELRSLLERALIPSNRTRSRFETFFRTQRALATDRTLQQLWQVLDSARSRRPKW